MATLAHRLTSLAMMIALSGSPAVLSACLALCMEGVGMAASHEGMSAEGHETEPAAPIVVAGHGHHGTPTHREAPSPVTHHSSAAPDVTDARLSAPCDNCCSSSQLAFVARLGVDRVDAKSIVAPLAAPVASFLLTRAVARILPPSSPVAPPAPPRAPLALRI